jgi:RNA polymerase sigma-70 factor (ECF subfamily)
VGEAEGPQEWLQAAREGDEGAFERLLRHYYRPLFRLVFQIVPNAEDTEEILQDAFFRFYKALRRLRPGEDPYPFLKAVAVRRAYTHLRRRRTAPLFEELPEEAVDLRVGGRAFEPARLFRWAWTLPHRQRIVFLLREVMGLPDGEVSALLGIAEVTVRRHASLAREAFRRALEEGGLTAP